MPAATAAATNTTPMFADTLMAPLVFPVGVLVGVDVGELVPLLEPVPLLLPEPPVPLVPPVGVLTLPLPEPPVLPAPELVPLPLPELLEAEPLPLLEPKLAAPVGVLPDEELPAVLELEELPAALELEEPPAALELAELPAALELEEFPVALGVLPAVLELETLFELVTPLPEPEPPVLLLPDPPLTGYPAASQTDITWVGSKPVAFWPEACRQL